MKNTEYELRILGIDVDEMKEKLRRAGATLVEEVYQGGMCTIFHRLIRTNGSGYGQAEATALGVMEIYREVYHINHLSIPILSAGGF